jgi:hypothetical protein
MAFRIRKIVVDGVTMVGCEQTGDDQETQPQGVAEATIVAASEGVTEVASPLEAPSVGPSREGVDYTPRGRLQRDAVDGAVHPQREMVQQRGAWVHRENWDELVPTRGKRGNVPARRHSGAGRI